MVGGGGGVLGTGQNKKGGGSLLRHIHELDIYASAPPELYDMLRKLLIPPPHPIHGSIDAVADTSTFL